MERNKCSFQVVDNLRHGRPSVVSLLTQRGKFANIETNWKEATAHLPISRRDAMLRTCSIQTPVFTLLYRGYDIEVSRAPSGWRVGVNPRTADLPILRCGEAYAGDQDAAVIEAKRRVDGALH